MLKDKIIWLSNLIKKVPKSSLIVMQGAGVSVAAGIPDFRTPKIGFYSRLKQIGISQPESIFDIDFFRNNPYPFYQVAHELLPGKFKPTTAHCFSKFMEEQGKLLRLYTQNIDGLERIAGMSEERLVEAHGHFRSAHCSLCNREMGIERVVNAIKNREPLQCQCGGWIKPDVVFFGENLPDRLWNLSDMDFSKCKLLIVMGTSLEVYPFASMIDFVSPSCPRVLINKEKPRNWNTKKDYFLMGDCQTILKEVMEQLKPVKQL